MIRAALISAFIGTVCAGTIAAQTNAVDSYMPPILSEADVAQQERCLRTMAAFPDDNATIRYQFFKLIDTMTKDATPDFVAALNYFGEGQVPKDLPLPEVIDGLANPVTRQAMPNVTVSQFAYLFQFSAECKTYSDGQMESLIAFDEALTNAEFNKVISEDALFLRQLLLDALFRLNADEHAVHGRAVQQDAVSLVRTRDEIEYAAFESSVSELETSFMGDLDGRLAKINDVINGEMDRDILTASVEMAKDMSEQSRSANRVNVWQILCPRGCEVTF